MLVHDMNIAEEIVQDGFARLWASPKTPAAEPDFRRYLYRTIANLARDHHRKLGRLARMPGHERIALNPLEEVDRHTGAETLTAALNVLPLRERQALYLRYLEDQSVAETARLMGAPQVTVRVLAYRGLNRLRRRLAADVNADRVAT